MKLLPGNFNLHIGDKFKTLLGDAGDQIASSMVPGWVIAKNNFKRLFAKNRLHSYKKGEYKSLKQSSDSAMSAIKKEISGTWNPFARVWNMVKFVFGITKQERIDSAIESLVNISDDPYAFESADEILKFSFNQLLSRIKSKEGWLSKLGLWNNKKVMEDPTVQSLSKLVVSSLHPYQELAHKAVPHLRFSKHDRDLLEKTADMATSGSKSYYTKDIGASIHRVIKEADKLAAMDQAKKQQQEHSPYGMGA